MGERAELVYTAHTELCQAPREIFNLQSSKPACLKFKVIIFASDFSGSTFNWIKLAGFVEQV